MLQSVNGCTLNLGLGPSDTWSNSGQISTTDAILNMNGIWSTSMPLSETGSTVNLGGSFKTSGLGPLSGSAGTYNFLGTLTNDATLTLDGAAISPAYYLNGGTINGGTVACNGGAELAVYLQGGTLSGITLQGTLDMALVHTGQTKVLNGLTLSGGIINIAGFAAGNNVLLFSGAQTLGGAGTVTFKTGINLPVIDNDSSLTIGPNVTIHGSSGTVGRVNSALTNNGTIASDQGGTITVQGAANFSGGTLTGGTWQVSAGSTLRLMGANIATNAATILVDGGSSHLYSDIGTTNALAGLTTNSGSLTIQNGANYAGSQAVTNSGSLTVGSGSAVYAGRKRHLHADRRQYHA